LAHFVGVAGAVSGVALGAIEPSWLAA